MFQRERTPDGCSVIASQEDVDVAQKLLNKVMKANRLGLPPYVHKFYFEGLEPTITEDGITREKFSQLYFAQFKERLGEKARKQLISLLSDAGLVEEKADPEDKRRMKIYMPSGVGEKKINFLSTKESVQLQCFDCRKVLSNEEPHTFYDGKPFCFTC